MTGPKVVDVVAAVRRRQDGKYWACRRNGDGAHGGLAGMWEYPGGKVEAGEEWRQALAREMDEEFGIGLIRFEGIKPITSVLASYDAEILYNVHFFAVGFSGTPELRCHTEADWFTAEELVTQPHLPSGAVFNQLLLQMPLLVPFTEPEGE